MENLKQFALKILQIDEPIFNSIDLENSIDHIKKLLKSDSRLSFLLERDLVNFQSSEVLEREAYMHLIYLINDHFIDDVQTRMNATFKLIDFVALRWFGFFSDLHTSDESFCEICQRDANQKLLPVLEPHRNYQTVEIGGLIFVKVHICEKCYTALESASRHYSETKKTYQPDDSLPF